MSDIDQVTQRCAKCILPDTYPGVMFNHEGVCNYCLEYRPDHQNLGKEALVNLLQSRPKSGEYDCVVPLSGGKDSTFILYYIVKELGLKPIAVNYDSGFQIELARDNVRNACDILDVPLVSATVPGNSQLKLLKQWILLSEKVGRPYGPCGGNCEAILRKTTIDTARAKGVPFIIWGSSSMESLNNNIYSDYINKGEKKELDIVRMFKWVVSKLKALFKDMEKAKKIPGMIYALIGYHAIMFNLISVYQRMKLGFPFRHAIKPRYVPPFTEVNPTFVHFFDYISWDSISHTETLKTKLKWKHPEGRESRFDCLIHCFVNSAYLRTNGITTDGANYCNFIREGRIDRESALNNEKAIVESLRGEIKEMRERIGLKGHGRLTS